MKLVYFIALAYSGLTLVSAGPSLAAMKPEQSVRKADAAFLQAVANSDKDATRRRMDRDFIWTDSRGKTLARNEVLAAFPKPADQANADITVHVYGNVATVASKRDNVYALRIYVKRSRGWRAFDYHEVTMTPPAAPAPPPASPPTLADCENPCKTLPYTPKSDAERGVIASWQALETAVVLGKGDEWAPHVADEFVVVGNTRVQTKAERRAVVNRAGSVPAPLVWAKMYEFGDAIVMLCQHQPHSGKPTRVSRVWMKRNGEWQMAVSYQTTMQDAPAHSH